MARLAQAALGLVLGGCTRIDLNHRATLPAAGLLGVEAAIERGNFSWFGRDEAVIAVDVWSWAAASGVRRSRAAEQTNDWGIVVDDRHARFWASSPAARAGVDMSAAGPWRVDLDLITLEGEVWVESVEGSVLATGDVVNAYDIEGPVDLFAWGAIDATVYPQPGDLVYVESAHGDVSLGLPSGLDYDLEVESGDIQLYDLGFDDIRTAPGQVEAVTLPATTTVRVSAGGRVVIYEVGP